MTERPQRRFVNHRGGVVSASGRVLTGLPGIDSDSYVRARTLLTEYARDLATRRAGGVRGGTAPNDAVRAGDGPIPDDDLEASIDRVSDAGERADLEFRLRRVRASAQAPAPEATSVEQGSCTVDLGTGDRR